MKVNTSETANQILDIAEQMVQTRGFNGFSYADIAAQLDVTKAALHYHFPSKAELSEALIARYTERFSGALSAIDGDEVAKLGAYVDIYTSVLRDNRMCLCGMLAAEFQTLSESARDKLLTFFDVNEAWLTSVLKDGQTAGTLRFTGQPTTVARMLVEGFEGAMLVARPYGDVERFQTTTQYLLSLVTGTDTPTH